MTPRLFRNEFAPMRGVGSGLGQFRSAGSASLGRLGQFAQAVEPGTPDLKGLRMVGMTVRGTEKPGATVEGDAW